MRRSHIKKRVFKNVKDFCTNKFIREMSQAHSQPPILISQLNAQIFKAIYNRDLLEEYKTTSYGLSKIACMCPSCPFFKIKLNESATGEQFDDLLLEHISGCLELGAKGYDIYSGKLNISDYIEFEGYFIS